MEVEKEIKRYRDRTSLRGRKGILKDRTMTKRPVRKPRPPTKKAIKAAVSAMTSAGFKVPEGMKVVINLEKDVGKTMPNKTVPFGRKNTNNKPNKNDDHPNRNNGGRLWGKKK